MADKTGIEWTEATWNPVTGCTKVSAGCKHCYAERDWARLSANPATRYHGRVFIDVQCHGDVLDQPLRWQRPRRIFVNSMSDLFHADVPDEFIDRVFAVMALAGRHTFQVLTKRADRMRAYLASPDVGARIGAAEHQFAHLAEFYKPRGGTRNVHLAARRHMPLPNVWLGVSVEDKTAADERIPLLQQTPAAVRWISAEPLLGPVDLSSHLMCLCGMCGGDSPLHWVVVGGESGPNARPMHPQWVRDMRDQCDAASVPFMFKQWGEWGNALQRPAGSPGRFALMREESSWSPITLIDEYPRQFIAFGAYIRERIGKKHAGRLLDGVLHDGYPEVQA